jgi:GDP-L-fucose synthase
VKVLLTGGSGFVGRSLAEALRERYTLFAPTHTELELLDAAAVQAFVASRRIDVVVHTAVRGGERVLEETLRMQLNLLQLADRVDRILYFGSGAEYAKARDLVKVKEEEAGTQVPADPYGLAKLICNDMARSRKRVVNLRLFGIYGPHEGYLYKFISNAIVKNLLGLDILIRQDVVFDYLFVDDLVPVVEHFLTSTSEFADYNVTPTESISLRELATLINRAAEQPSEIEVATPGLNWEYTGANARLRAAIPTLHFTSYEEGVRRLFAFYAARHDSIDAAAVRQDDYAARCRTRQ